MVTSTVEKLTETRVKLAITVAPDELKPSITHAYEHIGKDLAVPGFRKGKVPAPIIDQRVGKGYVLEHAINDGLDGFYRAAVAEHSVRPLGNPSADITEWPSDKDFSGDLIVTIEVDVRPEITLPDYAGLTATVDAVSVSDEEVDAELESLRTRFGTLVTVDRPAKTGDFAQIDLVASVDGNVVDTANGISHELGSGELIEGVDDALDSLSAGEETVFSAPLLGGEFAGQDAEITLTLHAVKERELPEADDDFAQIASEFDTIAELRDSLRTTVEQRKSLSQGSQARDLLVEQLLEQLQIPVPPALIDEEVRVHLENEGKPQDDPHGEEVREQSETSFRNQMLLDAVAEAEDVKVSQAELSSYILQRAQQSGYDPSEYLQALQSQNQIPVAVGEVARTKAVAIILDRATVVDSDGKPVDVSAFTAILREDEPETGDAAEATEEAADEAKA